MDGHILVGSTVEEVGFDKSTTMEARHMLESKVRAMWPAITQFPFIKQWSGLRPATPDGIPVICPYPGVENLYLNTGHYRSGILLAPASARLVSDMILGRQTSFAAAAFRLKEKPGISTADV
jgi:glycine oxidase